MEANAFMTDIYKNFLKKERGIHKMEHRWSQRINNHRKSFATKIKMNIKKKNDQICLEIKGHAEVSKEKRS